MHTSASLRHHIQSIDRSGYPAYKGLRGTYDFGPFELSINHVQGDPFAAPSQVSVFVPHEQAGFAPELYAGEHRRLALEDLLVRALGRACARYSFKVGGSGKSGLFATSRPGPEIIRRTACTIDAHGINACLELGFPAHGRSIEASALRAMLFDFLPRCVDEALMSASHDPARVRAAIHLADDQLAIHEALVRLGLVSFVANGSVLPRESGVASRPLRTATPFVSPRELEVAIDLPHRGRTCGMGVPAGVTLIVGGGYHGKSTLLRAIEAGVYPHVAGDGRELVATDPTAVKLRAEDGRAVHDVDVSLFIDNLPSGQSTRHFSTADASGSTSEAASLIEAVESGARTLLIDEDTSATNLMVRDPLMAAVVSREHEPVTPFVERARDLFEVSGISSVIVAGSSGAFFAPADVVIQMDRYQALDITARVRQACQAAGVGQAVRAADYALPTRERFLPGELAQAPRDERGRRLRVRSGGCSYVEAGPLVADLGALEQLVDPEQATALAHLVRLALERGLIASCSVTEMAAELLELVSEQGLGAIGDTRAPACGLALPRPQELFACLNRLRLRE